MKRILLIISVLIVVLASNALTGCESDLESKKESYKNAAKIDFEEFDKELASNAQGAKDKYSGQSFSLTGYVSEIGEEKISIVPLESPIKSDAVITTSSVDAYISKDEIKSVEKHDLIIVAGDISNISEGTNTNIEMKNAVIMNDTIEISGKVENFILNQNNTYKIRIRAELSNAPEGYFAYYDYTLKDVKPQEQSLNEATIDGQTFKPGDTVTIEAKVKYNHKTYNGEKAKQVCSHYLEMTEIISAKITK